MADRLKDSQESWRLSGQYHRPVVTLDIRQVVGRLCLTAVSHVGRLARLVLEIIRGLGEWRVWVPLAFEQARSIGYGSLFIVILTSMFAGAVVSLQAGYQWVTGSIPIYYAAGVIVQSVTMELGPVLTALLLAGRIGARYAAELGTMRVTEQVDALESLGRNVISYLIIPRVVAGTLMLPVLVVIADIVGIGAGFVAAKSSLGMTNGDFIRGATFFYQPFDPYYSMIKSFFFGLAVTIVPCYLGMSTQQGAEGVGRSTTGAVVSASVIILFLDAILTQLLLK
ncbi:MAG: ABC transporter permease [Gemmatimonadetes bacterium]|nr:ABC transporter permease [Gemmatimonadota bacterium]